jgi:putative membrane protein
MKNMFAFLIIACSCSLTSCGNNENDSKKAATGENKEKFDSIAAMQDDAKFAVAAADGGMLEVQLGKLAQTNASADPVKRFGRMMIDDHSMAGEELKRMAKARNITLPATLSNKNQDAYNDLAKKKGADFDKAYTSFMVDDHKEDIDEFKKESAKGNDTDIKNWATGKIPVLEHHLVMAKRADSTVRKQ